MTSLLRTKSIQLKPLKYLIFRYVPIKIDIELPEKYVKNDIMKYEEIPEGAKNNHVTEMLNHYRNESEVPMHHLDKYFEKNKSNEEIIKKEIYENTFFERSFETWDITNLTRKYDIKGKEIFMELVKFNSPFNMGILDHKSEKDKLDKIDEAWENNLKDRSENKYVFFDYYNGIAIKNSFPINPHEGVFKFRIKKYNDRTAESNNGFKKILDILNSKIEKVKSGEIQLKEFIRYVNDEENRELSEKEFIKMTDEINKNKKAFSNIPFEKTNLVPQGYYNHRCIFEKKVWDYMLFPSEESIKKEPLYLNIKEYKEFVMKGIEDGVFDLDNYFQLKYNKLIPYGNTRLENLSIVNCLIFGKTRIQIEHLEKLLSLIRYRNVSYFAYYLDNYILDFSEKYFEDSNYSIKIDTIEKSLEKLDYYNDDRTKNQIAKYLIQLMNEVRPELLNEHNYNVIVKYLKNTFIEETYLWNLVEYEKNRINKNKF